MCECAERLSVSLKAWGWRLHNGLWYFGEKPILPRRLAERHTTASLIIAWQTMTRHQIGRWQRIKVAFTAIRRRRG